MSPDGGSDSATTAFTQVQIDSIVRCAKAAGMELNWGEGASIVNDSRTFRLEIAERRIAELEHKCRVLQGCREVAEQKIQRAKDALGVVEEAGCLYCWDEGEG